MMRRAEQVIRAEIAGIRALRAALGDDFRRAVETIAGCAGRVVVCGVGKSGIVARKMAATLSSTGTPSLFLHAGEAVHGDLGQVTRQDVVLLLSQSGETSETLRLIPTIKKIGAVLIAITGRKESSLGRHSDVVLHVPVKEEGCPLGLAPMASTTAALVLGDCLAACLMDRKRFRSEDFALFHPGGALGRRLLLKVDDIMRQGVDLAVVDAADRVQEVLWAITRARSGCACVVDGRGRLKGLFTDGDLRRHLEIDASVLARPVGEVMTRDPLTLAKGRLAAEAFELLQRKRVDELPVVDRAGKLLGLVDVQDLLRAGLV
jgi:arabinose-5-phosphate isomerase